jgi:hypothetical protein
MRIIISNGLLINKCLIKFNSTRTEIIDSIKKPDKIYYSEEGDVRWQYFNYMIELSFERENNFKLGWIEIYNETVEIFSFKPIKINKTKVLEVINNRFSYSPEIDDYGSFESYFYEKDWLELQFMFNRLVNINFGQ